MTQQEALKLALKALELNNSEWKDLANSGDSGYWKAEDQGHYQLTIEAITAIKEALAQQQEPVAYGMWDTMIGKGNRMMMVRLDKGQDGCTVPLYTTPLQPEQEPQYAGTARELFTNAAIERLDVRPSTKVYLGTPSVCEQHQDWCASLTQMLTSMPPKPAPCNCKPPQPEQEPVKINDGRITRFYDGSIGIGTPPQSEPVIDKSAAIRIATSLGWEPKRTWMGLTQEDIDIAFDDTQEGGGFWEFARAIEAKLKEKNT